MGLRLGGAAVWLCRGGGHGGGRVCSAESNVSPRYQNFFINEDTQTSEGRGWGSGAGEAGGLQTHLLAAALTRCSRLDDLFFWQQPLVNHPQGLAQRESPPKSRGLWRPLCLSVFIRKVVQLIIPRSGGAMREEELFIVPEWMKIQTWPLLPSAFYFFWVNTTLKHKLNCIALWYN